MPAHLAPKLNPFKTLIFAHGRKRHSLNIDIESLPDLLQLHMSFLIWWTLHSFGKFSSGILYIGLVNTSLTLSHDIDNGSDVMIQITMYLEILHEGTGLVAPAFSGHPV